jgi:hypothetical protein
VLQGRVPPQITWQRSASSAPRARPSGLRGAARPWRAATAPNGSRRPAPGTWPSERPTCTTSTASATRRRSPPSRRGPLPHCTERTNAPPATSDWLKVARRLGLTCVSKPGGCAGMAWLVSARTRESRDVGSHLRAQLRWHPGRLPALWQDACDRLFMMVRGASDRWRAPQPFAAALLDAVKSCTLATNVSTMCCH